MNQRRSGTPGFRLDIQQILSEAQYRWLRPAEICEILRNYIKFHISPEAPTKPVSGSVFIFDRKVLRYFRKDGHNWRKKKDGKTVKEAHEKLKVGSIDMLHCYYAHGEDNENFQRRSYWLLEQDLMHIVFVHYLEVKGKDSSLSSSFHGTSPTSPLSSTYEDAESEGNQQGSSESRPYQESPLGDECHSSQSSSFGQPFGNQSIDHLNYAPLSVVRRDGDFGGVNSISRGAPADLASWTEVNENHTAGKVSDMQESSCYVPTQANWLETSNSFAKESLSSDHENGVAPVHSYLVQKAQSGNLQILISDEEIENAANPNLGDNSTAAFENENYSFLLKKNLISGLQPGDSLMKVDSFSRWIAKELGEADGLDMQPSNGMSWSIMGSEYEANISAQLQVDSETLSPSISQDQLFSIIDFSPHWAYSNLETKVLIVGMFLKSEQALSECRWSIMFGQVEVQAEVLANGILCCSAPLHITGLLPLYVTCSNRLACSEIREFEYRDELDRDTGSVDVNGGNVAQMHLCQRFETILHLESHGSPLKSTGDDFDKQTVTFKIHSLREDHSGEEKLSEDDLLHRGELALEKELKEKFFSWLLHRVAEDGKGLTIFDEWGQNVLHVAAALGFIWAFKPFIISGVNIDFRDVNGWTALHWAAFYGREKAVVALVSLGAAPGLLTDPSTKHPICTPADLASSNGHKGISGFLAETSLTTHLSTLRVNDDGATDVSGVKPFQTFSDHLAAPITEEDVPETLSLKDSLAAVCNATQAAARIHQIFRIQSFQRKQLIENLDDQAICLVAAKTSRLGHSDGMANSAALQIQKKYRGWKKRKEYLLIRQKIVKIQAHVRGHQVRKKNNHFVWSVRMLEKVILRWRRKRSVLHGLQSKNVEVVGPSAQGISSSSEDDYDILKQGRQEAEKRMEKALARVKSMAQYPEARAQYRRLITAAQDFSETKDISDMILPGTMEDMSYFEDELIDVESLMDDETFMSLTFQ